jgi:hypothetical protein
MLRLAAVFATTPFCDCSTTSSREPILAAIKVVGLVGFNSPKPFNTIKRRITLTAATRLVTAWRGSADRTLLHGNFVLTESFTGYFAFLRPSGANAPGIGAERGVRYVRERLASWN